MFSAKTIEIAIGLVFFYLLLSLLVTTINEMIQAIFELRGRELRKAIGNMLGEVRKSQFYAHPLIKTSGKLRRGVSQKGLSKRERFPSYIRPENFAQVVTEIVSNELFFKRKHLETLLSRGSNSPMSKSTSLQKEPAKMNLKEIREKIAEIENPQISGKSISPVKPDDALSNLKVSYGEAADADWIGLVETIEGMDFPQETKDLILSLAKRSGGDLYTFKKHLENWFEGMMERLKGWYVRYMKVITFIVALSVAIIFNADTFRVTQSLSNDSVRKEMVAAATQYTVAAKTGISPVDSYRSESESVVVDRLDSLGKKIESLINHDIANANEVMGLGWTAPNKACAPNYCDCKISETKKCNCDAFWAKLGCGLKKFSGWLLTAIAISLGAPFWFDLLKKLISIRSAGVNPSDEKKKGSSAHG